MRPVGGCIRRSKLFQAMRGHAAEHV